MSDEHLPFFIEWDIEDGQHPGLMAADHDVEPAGISWIELGGDHDRLADWLGEHTLPIRYVEEYAGPRTVAIATSDRIVRITIAGIA